MLRPVRLLLAVLIIVFLSPAVRAEEVPRRTPSGSHARRHHHRRAKFGQPVRRAPRSGPAGARAAAAKAKRPPPERPESIGSPNDGHLKGGAHLDLSKRYLRVVPAYESGDVRWALPVMIRMIDRAAYIVSKRFPGSVLDVGDLSRSGGGDVLRHHSHESGRDADVGFYAFDARDKPIHGRTFVKFEPNLASLNYPGARFDPARNWTFVQALLTDPGARVSHIFVAEWLKHELLAYARPRVSRALYDRAALVLMQPTKSLPHDDHFHVRISCPRAARSACVELAKNAPRGKTRVARKGRVQPLKTPATHAHTPAGHHPRKPPAAMAVKPQDPFALPPLPNAEPDTEPPDDDDDVVD